MLQKLRALAERYEKLSLQLADPKTLENSQNFQKLSKELSNLSPAFEAYQRLEKNNRQIQETEMLLTQESNAELKSMAEEELHALKKELEIFKQDALVLLLPNDPNDDGNAIVEIRAGTGGDEAALFVGDMAKMYRRYAEKKGFQCSVFDFSPSEKGGFKEIVLQVEGNKAFHFFKNEAGTHRVQRVPETEAQGRVHTSTITVAVLPETEEVEDFEINPSELKIDTFRSQGAGGQHVNTTDSAVRITHLPTGTVVACQEERSQIKNRAKAMKYLKTKLLTEKKEKQASQISSMRKNMVGTGDRSERIRTYNYPQGRITEHRAKVTLYQLEEVMNNGDLDEIVDQLLLQERLEQLKAMQLEP